MLTATPYVWLAILLPGRFGVVSGHLPHLLRLRARPSTDVVVAFIGSLLSHWFLPFLSLFLVLVGGWAIGMRNLIIYELETDYANYLDSLGAPDRLVRRYAFRNALLPQITGLALQLGVIVAGDIVTEIVFSYPGLGYLILQAITRTGLLPAPGGASCSS